MTERELDEIEAKAKWSSWDRNGSKTIIIQLLIEIKRLNKLISKAVEARYG